MSTLKAGGLEVAIQTLDAPSNPLNPENSCDTDSRRHPQVSFCVSTHGAVALRCLNGRLDPDAHDDVFLTEATSMFVARRHRGDMPDEMVAFGVGDDVAALILTRPSRVQGFRLWLERHDVEAAGRLVRATLCTKRHR